MESAHLKMDLQRAIILLENLLTSECREEKEYQSFFEENPVVFSVLGYRDAVAMTQSSRRSLPRDEYTNLKPEPDFLVQREDGVWEIFELKTPFVGGLIKDRNPYRERLTSVMMDYVSQTSTYEEYFSGNPANRVAVRDLFGIELNERLDIKIVSGMASDFDRHKLHKHCRRMNLKVDVHGFDEILQRLESHYEKIFGKLAENVGLSVYCLVRFLESDVQHDRYLFEFGNDSDPGKVCIYLKGENELFLSLTDDSKDTYCLSFSSQEGNLYGDWICIGAVFTWIGDTVVMSLSVNGQVVDERRKMSGVSVRIPMREFTLGSDCSLSKPGRFDMGPLYVFAKSLSDKDHLKMIHFLWERVETGQVSEKCMYFDKGKFMKMDEKGDLKQENKDFQPIVYGDHLERP